MAIDDIFKAFKKKQGSETYTIEFFDFNGISTIILGIFIPKLKWYFNKRFYAVGRIFILLTWQKVISHSKI